MSRLWDNPWIRFLVIASLVVVFLFLCYVLQDILIPLLLAFLVAYILNPVVDVLEKRGVRRTFTVVILLILIIVLVTSLLIYFVPKMADEFSHVVTTTRKSFPAFRARLEQLISRYSGHPLGDFVRGRVDDSLESLRQYSPRIMSSVGNLVVLITQKTANVVGFVLNFVLFSVVTVYLLKDFDQIVEKGRRLIPLSREQEITSLLSKIDLNLRSFFRGQITVSIILSVIYTIGLTLIGVPFALVVGLLGGFGNIIPYFGTAVGIVLAMFLALIQFQDVLHPLMAAGVFVLGQTLEGSIIGPNIVGQRVGLHPVVVIVSVLIWGKLMGFLGILLAVPIAAVGKVLVDEGLERYKTSQLYLAEPKATDPLKPEEQNVDGKGDAAT